MRQRNLYMAQPGLLDGETRILAVRRVGDGMAVAVRENLHRPEGGGEPADRGSLALDGGDARPVRRVEKAEGRIWLHVGAQSADALPSIGSRACVHVDAAYRDVKRRLHTLEHIAASIALRALPDFKIAATRIDADSKTAMIAGWMGRAATHDDLNEIDEGVQEVVWAERPVSSVCGLRLAEARKTYGRLFRLNDRDRPAGPARLVVIEDLDANPCSGCHFGTSDVGPYKMTLGHGDRREIQTVFMLELRPIWPVHPIEV